jgi:hypothetical protein
MDVRVITISRSTPSTSIVVIQGPFYHIWLGSHLKHLTHFFPWFYVFAFLLHKENLFQLVFLLLSFLFSITFFSSSWFPSSCLRSWTIGFRWGELHIHNYIWKEKKFLIFWVHMMKWEKFCRFFSFILYLFDPSDSYIIYLIQWQSHVKVSRGRGPCNWFFKKNYFIRKFVI